MEEMKDKRAAETAREEDMRTFFLPIEGAEPVEVSLEELIVLACKGRRADEMEKELSDLRRDKARREGAESRLQKLFPGVTLEDVERDEYAAPHIQAGMNYEAAWALARAEREQVERWNTENARRSTGDVGRGEQLHNYYSDEQIEHMSMEDVKKKFPDIMKRFRKMKGE